MPPNTYPLALAINTSRGRDKTFMLHFVNVQLPGSNRLEVDLGYGTDVFTASDGTEFLDTTYQYLCLGRWISARKYIRNGGAGGSIQIDKYGRGESPYWRARASKYFKLRSVS